jgi:hypothetical protein
MIGPGKYNHLCTFVRQSVMADGVVLIVIGGCNGEGFECQFTTPELAVALPAMLRTMADQIEADVKKEVPSGKT